MPSIWEKMKTPEELSNDKDTRIIRDHFINEDERDAELLREQIKKNQPKLLSPWLKMKAKE